MAHQHGDFDNEFQDETPDVCPSGRISLTDDGSRSSAVNAHQGAQFSDAPTELPQNIELDRDDADTAVTGGLDFIEKLRERHATENEWGIGSKQRPKDSVAVEPSEGSRTVLPETYTGTYGDSKKILSSASSEIRPTGSSIFPPQNPTPNSLNVTTGTKIKGFLKNVPLGVSFVIVIPTVVGVAVGLGTKSLASGVAVGGSFLAICTALFACLHVVWKEDRVEFGGEHQQRQDGPSNGP
ncbi:MAG: hypothetical protein M1839_003599 [Geoglossum umbratile]|nr:MAG: hypothetical protein M1839_003599 [Geoglossum umbratile]